MPAASPTPLLPPHASATLLAHIGANGKPSASTSEFAELFRQKAGADQISFSNAASTNEQSRKTSSSPDSPEISASKEAEDQKGQTGKIPSINPDPKTFSVKPQPQSYGKPDAILAGIARQMKQDSSASAESSKESMSVSATRAGTAPRPGRRGSVPADPQHKANVPFPAHAVAAGTIDGAVPFGLPTAAPVLPGPKSSSLSSTQPAPSSTPRRASAATAENDQASPKDLNSSVIAPAPIESPENRTDAPQAVRAVARSQEQSSTNSSASKLPNPEQGTAGATEGVSLPKESPQSPTAPHISPSERAALLQHADAPAGPAAAAAAFAPAHPPASQAAFPQMASAVPAPISAAAPAAASAPNGVVAAPNIYDKLDQESAPVVLHSGAQHVAVGVRDPDLGWVEIKTQNIAGQVDATLVTTTSQAHTSLAAQLPAMAQYLEQREVRLGTLAVHHEMPGNNAGTASGGSQSSDSGSARGSAQNSGSGEARVPDRYSGSSSGSALLRPKTEEEAAWFHPVSFISVRA